VRFDQLPRTLVCVGCGRGDVTLRKLPESVWPNARACDSCLGRFGRLNLATEADQFLAGLTPAQVTRALAAGGRCLHCGAPTRAQDDGMMPAWCGGCEADRRRLLT
jgi:hypothetical protein